MSYSAYNIREHKSTLSMNEALKNGIALLVNIFVAKVQSEPSLQTDSYH